MNGGNAEVPTESNTAPPRDRGPFFFVWGCWLVLLAFAVVQLATFGRNVPYWDDWFQLPYLTGHEPATPAWLWDQIPNTESRVLLPKLLWLALFQLGGGNLLVVQWYNLAALAVLAAALVLLLARLRGALAYEDAFFPLVFLHWGHAETFVWATLIMISLPLLLAGSGLLLAARYGCRLTPGAALLGGVCVLLLPLCGAYGLVFVPFLGLWLACSLVYTWRSDAPRRGTTVMVILFFLAATFAELLAYYLVEFDPTLGQTSRESKLGKLEAVVKVFAATQGPVGYILWPWSGIGPTVALVLSGVFLMDLVCRWNRPEAARAVGLLLVLAASAALALGTGFKRPSEWCLVPYYGTLPALGLCSAHLAWSLYGPPSLRRLAPMCLLLLAASCLGTNTAEGLRIAAARAEVLDALTNEVRDGVPTSLLVKNHATKVLWPWPGAHEATVVFHKRLADGLHELHSAGIGVFERLQPDPPFRLVALRLNPVETHGVTWVPDPKHGRSGTGRAEGADAYLVFPLATPRHVVGIRIRYTHANSRLTSRFYPVIQNDRPAFQVCWRKSGAERYDPADCYLDVENATDGEQTVTIWIYETIDQLKVLPDRQPCAFAIAEITLLIDPT